MENENIDRNNEDVFHHPKITCDCNDLNCDKEGMEGEVTVGHIVNCPCWMCFQEKRKDIKGTKENKDIGLEPQVLTLKYLKEKYERIASDWNGKDGEFLSGGIAYTESHATSAQDIIDQIVALEDMIANFDF